MPIQKFEVTLDIIYNREVAETSRARRGDLKDVARSYLHGERSDVVQTVDSGEQEIPDSLYFTRQVELLIYLDDEMNCGTPKGWPWDVICDVRTAKGERVESNVTDPVCVSR